MSWGSSFGKKLLALMGITTIEDTDYLIVQKNTDGDQFTRKILWSDVVALVDAAINPINLVVNNANTPYQVSDADSSTFLVFDDPGNAVVSIPDGLTTGVNFAYTNKGAGSVQVSFIGADTLRGVALVGTATGYAAITKIDDTTWQTSER